MKTSFVLVFCSATSLCVGELACSADAISDSDTDNDRCQLLQGGVGVVSHHDKAEKDQHAKAQHEDGHRDKQHIQHQKHELKKVDASGPFDDIFKTVKNVVGSTDKLEKDFDAIKKAVVTFAHEVHETVAVLTSNAKADMTMKAALSEVESAEKKVHASALKLWKALEEATKSFVTGIGSIAPPSFKSAMQSALEKVRNQARAFAGAFNHAATEVEIMKNNINHTAICETVSHHLDGMHKTVEKLVADASALSTKNLNKDILKAKDALPDAIKNQIDKLLEKADEAAEKIVSLVSPTVQEISSGVAQALQGYCSLQSGAGRMQVGIFSLLAIGIASFLI